MKSGLDLFLLFLLASAAMYAEVQGFLHLRMAAKKTFMVFVRAGGNIVAGIGLGFLFFSLTEGAILLAVAATLLLVHPAESKEQSA